MSYARETAVPAHGPVAADENPEDEPVPTAPTTAILNDEDLLQLIPSTNPLFPNAIVKKPTNTHSKANGSKPKEKDEAVPKSPTTPFTGKNAPVRLLVSSFEAER